jgi:hypothetical protein
LTIELDVGEFSLDVFAISDYVRLVCLLFVVVCVIAEHVMTYCNDTLVVV